MSENANWAWLQDKRRSEPEKFVLASIKVVCQSLIDAMPEKQMTREQFETVDLLCARLLKIEAEVVRGIKVEAP